MTEVDEAIRYLNRYLDDTEAEAFTTVVEHIERLRERAEAAEKRLAKIERDGFHHCRARDGKPVDYAAVYCSMCSGACDSCQIRIDNERLREALEAVWAVATENGVAYVESFIAEDMGRLGVYLTPRELAAIQAALDATAPEGGDDGETTQSQCPQCNKWQDDLDGFGVLACDACGWCSHPSICDDVCEICGKKLRKESNG